MGNGREYVESGGFSQYLYHQVGDKITASNGVQGEVVTKYDDPLFHTSLPIYTNTSEVYFKNSNDNGIEQARVYGPDRHAKLDFDWGHDHKQDGMVFKKGTVHVQPWYKNAKGEWKRGKARYMNNDEINRYGELLKLANPNVKLRP